MVDILETHCDYFRNCENYHTRVISRGPIHEIVTRELNMNGFWDFQQILVYRTAGLLNSIDSFSFKRVRIEIETAVVSRVSMATQPSGRNIWPYTNITLV